MPPDLSRPFCCEKCFKIEEEKEKTLTSSLGRVFNIFSTGEWVCVDCGVVQKKEFVEKAIKMEKEIEEEGIGSVDEVLEKINRKLLHPTHFQFFWSLYEIVNGLDRDDSMFARESVFIWGVLVQNMVVVLPRWHHEVVVFYDRLAQGLVLDGRVEEAKKVYGKAWEMSCVVSGKDMPSTLEIKKLFDDPPKNKQELIDRYNR